jgi:hypothetical protein
VKADVLVIVDAVVAATEAGFVEPAAVGVVSGAAEVVCTGLDS